MIRCICIDDRLRPNDIPLSKWVKEGEEYNIIFATVVLPQGLLAFQLQEIDLDNTCYPYQYFAANRFAIDYEDMDRLEKLVMDSAKAKDFYKQVIMS